ncbi:hypothetical protein [Actinacidiphila sp. ITFR-21]|uniref:hypothetical protein n=1 Tax=Actinacidiphila sp. ITFR-21 TaxID=3075199 RepID=UPI00288A2932|nr:hypothetical protein [Streptomyces sp. ITFR-21]WNI14097.1 hypothetical protein RLT57_00180 [Streptomyces sp. ITFR-21]
MAFESFDMIFHQPDICLDLDDSAVEATTYPATADRTGETWTVDVHSLPDGLSVRAEGSTWREVEEAVVTRVPRELKAGPGTVIVSVKPADPEAAAAVGALTRARLDRAYAEQAERDAARAAVRVLAAQGWSAEDAGTVLRLPTARIDKLLAAASGLSA